MTKALHTMIQARSPKELLRLPRIIVGLLLALFAFEVFAWLGARPPGLSAISYPGFGFLPALPSLIAAPFCAVWIALSLFFSFGVLARYTGTLAALITAYVFAQDQMLSSNHGLLLLLETIFITMALFTEDKETVARWPIVLLLCLISSVYAFTVLSKLNGDFLSGEVIFFVLGKESLLPLPGVLLTLPMVRLISIALLLTESFLAFALWVPSLRKIAVWIGILLHSSALLIFPFLPGNWIAFIQIGGGILAVYPLFLRR